MVGPPNGRQALRECCGVIAGPKALFPSLDVLCRADLPKCFCSVLIEAYSSASDPVWYGDCYQCGELKSFSVWTSNPPLAGRCLFIALDRFRHTHSPVSSLGIRYRNYLGKYYNRRCGSIQRLWTIKSFTVWRLSTRMTVARDLLLEIR